MKRETNNPIILPSDVKPSRPDMIVDCAFNAGVAQYNDEIILLLRVGESFITDDENTIAIPVLENGEIVRHDIDKKNPPEGNWDFSDARTVKKDGNVVYLTTLSHLRIARSKDGVNFDIEEKPFIQSSLEIESWGCEDPRITKLDNEYYINYTGVSQNGILTMLAKTKDFKTAEKIGPIFMPECRNVTIFPEKINEKYHCLVRPVPRDIGQPQMWIADSDNLTHWGNFNFMFSTTPNTWESGRVGGGMVPIKTKAGWLVVYHAASLKHEYGLGLMLLDLEDPTKIIKRLNKPILTPDEDYEKKGFFGNVVFTCGGYMKDDIIHIYYGAADANMCLVRFTLEEMLGLLEIKE